MSRDGPWQFVGAPGEPAMAPRTETPQSRPSPSPQASAVPPPRAQRNGGFSFRKFVLYTLGFGSLLYAGGVWYSLRDNDFHDEFTTYVPFSDFVITKIEDAQLTYKFDKTDRPIASPHAAHTGTKNVLIGKDSVVSRQVPKESVAAAPSSAPSAATGATASAASAPVADKKKKDSVKPAAPSSSEKKPSGGVALPLIHAPGDLDPLLSRAVEDINSFIQQINQQKLSEEAVSRISGDVAGLSQALSALREEHKQELRQSLAAQANKFASLGEATRDEVRDALEKQRAEFIAQFKAEEQRLVDLYNKRLQIEIEATKKAVVQYANNQLLAQRAEQDKQFAREIAYRVDQERDGRFAGLDKLSESIDELTEYAVSSGNAYDDYENIAKFHVALGNLASVLSTRREPVPLGPYLKQIASALPQDPLVAAVLKSIPQDVADEGVLAPSQLAARFRLLEPEIRKASLLPPDAGVAGHVGSWLFSKLLWKKTGTPVGDDTESVIARAETALSEGRVVDAVAEVNSLKGWPRKLASDWLVEARKRSEVEFLVGVLAEEGRLWSFSGSK